MKKLNMLGQPCPIPVIQSKKALAEGNISSIIVSVDNDIAVQNLEKMAFGLGYSFSYDKISDSHYDVTISTNKDFNSTLQASTKNSNFEFASQPQKGSVVAISQNAMGHGSEELGKILIKGFIFSLSELNPPPSKVLFYNSGAYLSCNDSNTIDDLKQLEANGCEILSCGTCINYFGLQDKLAVGKICDMYEIVSAMAEADSVINI